MDVRARKAILALSFGFLFSACSPKTSSSVFDQKAQGSSLCTGESLPNRFVVQWEDGHFSVESAADADKFTSEFLEPNLENIRKVEYDRVFQFDRTVSANSDSNDVVNSMGTVDTWGQTMVGADKVWAQGVYGEGVIVGVVDSYVDIKHAQLAPRVAMNTGEIPGNGIDDDKNGYIDDVYGWNFVSHSNDMTPVADHGTHVAGIISADHQTGSIRGLAPKAKIIPAPFIDGGGSIGDAILALQYVSQRGARIINASWGGGDCVDSLRNAFIELNKKGVLIVVAAGNDGHDIDYQPEYPAAFNMPNQITVAAASSSDFMASWSNMSFNLVHLAAPGVNILSTVPNNRTAYMDGTSMAAPFVSGAAALLWSDRPQATAQQIKKALLTSVDVTPNHEYKVQTMGRLNVNKALATLRQMVP